MGFPVDVFHAVNKHKGSDHFCATRCNPVVFDDLRQGSEWTFNSSAAEQTNVWFGKFTPIVREMTETHYNFFLDDVIMTHNEHQEQVLGQRGCFPRLVPVDELTLS